MSAMRSLLTLAALAAVFPLAMMKRERPSPRSGATDVTPAAVEQQPADPAAVRTFLQGVRGANAVQCELILQSFHGWSSDAMPDRDSVAWAVTNVVRQRAATSQSVPDLMAALRSDDECAARTAARLLGRSRLPAARTELLAALGDADAQVRRLAAIGLGFSSDTTASRALVRVLADRDARVRAAAAWALGAVH
jgi:HEAT repeat protein